MTSPLHKERMPDFFSKSKTIDTELKDAIRVIFKWIGEDPDRESLKESPSRVIRAFGEYFKGYHMDPTEILSKTFTDIGGYIDPIIVQNIDFVSHCEHHFAPIIGRVHFCYLPDEKVVGLSKIPRLVETFSRRLQIQERMTAQIAETFQTCINPKGVIVMAEAEHFCVKIRGVELVGSNMITTHATGIYKDDPALKLAMLSMLKK